MTLVCLAVSHALPAPSGLTSNKIVVLTGKIVGVAAPVTAGIAAYFLVAFVLRLDELWMLFRREKSSVPASENAALLDDEIVDD